MKAERLFDALTCGTDVAKQKVHFDLIDLALKRLRIRDRSRTILIGDTPFDAIAAPRACSAVGRPDRLFFRVGIAERRMLGGIS